MRIAILSDIHGNLTALEAVVADLDLTKPDLVLQGGDLAFSGCQPAEVIDLISQRGWDGVLGNTDEMLWTAEALPQMIAAAPKLEGLLRILFETFAPATRALIGEHRIAWLWLRPCIARENLRRAERPDRGLLSHAPAFHPSRRFVHHLQQRQRWRAV